jgi:hypothetical protein
MTLVRFLRNGQESLVHEFGAGAQHRFVICFLVHLIAASHLFVERGATGAAEQRLYVCGDERCTQGGQLLLQRNHLLLDAAALARQSGHLVACCTHFVQLGLAVGAQLRQLLLQQLLQRLERVAGRRYGRASGCCCGSSGSEDFGQALSVRRQVARQCALDVLLPRRGGGVLQFALQSLKAGTVLRHEVGEGDALEFDLRKTARLRGELSSLRGQQAELLRVGLNLSLLRLAVLAQALHFGVVRARQGGQGTVGFLQLLAHGQQAAMSRLQVAQLLHQLLTEGKVHATRKEKNNEQDRKRRKKKVPPCGARVLLLTVCASLW